MGGEEKFEGRRAGVGGYMGRKEVVGRECWGVVEKVCPQGKESSTVN